MWCQYSSHCTASERDDYRVDYSGGRAGVSGGTELPRAWMFEAHLASYTCWEFQILKEGRTSQNTHIRDMKSLAVVVLGRPRSAPHQQLISFKYIIIQAQM